MTNVWGPLAWMSLHSVSLLYPENPSESDKLILKRYMEVFRESLTCPQCHKHFGIMFNNYTSSHPEWVNSRYNFFMFVVRLHNTVNRRLHKSMPNTVQESIDTIHRNLSVKSGHTYRNEYISYLIRNWTQELSGDSLIKMASVRDMKKITDEYWNQKTDDSTESFNMNGDVLEFVEESPRTRHVLTSSGVLASLPTMNLRVGFRGGRFRLN